MRGVFIFEYVYGIIGTDLRQQLLLQELGKEDSCIFYEVYGKTKEQKIESRESISKERKVQRAESLKEAVEKCSILLLPIPMCKKGKINITGEEITEEEFLTYLKSGQSLYAGKITDKFQKAAEKKGVSCYDYMEEERIAIYNSIATAEGTIAEMIRTSLCNLQGRKVLVLGYGRCGRILAKKLQALDALVTVCARRKEVLMEAHVFGCQTFPLQELGNRIKEFPLIINTIPERILGKEILKEADPASIFYEIASEPYGIDGEEAKKRKIRVEILGALPGKYSPVSSALILKEYILENREKNPGIMKKREDQK